MTVGDLCNRRVVIATPDESLTAAARRMSDLHVGTLVVVNDTRGGQMPIGVLTDRDLVVRVLAERRDVDRLVVREVMTGELVTARESENLYDALKKMRSFGVRRLPIVDDDGALVGILTFDDLVELVAEELSDLSSLVSREQKREREAPPHLVR